VTFLLIALQVAVAAQDCAPEPELSAGCNDFCVKQPVIGGLNYIVCDLSPYDVAADVVAVHNRQEISDSNFSVYGQVNNYDFACCFDNSPEQTLNVQVIGTAKGDIIGFVDGNYQMENPTTGAFIGRIGGAAGSDDIEGSAFTDISTLGVCGGSGYIDCLTGGNGSDVISGLAGQDFILGGNHDDTIYCGADDDYCDGSQGDDRVAGDGGDDAVVGGDGADVLRGNAGEDTIIGGDGDDVLCSGLGTGDSLDGGSGVDTLWASSGATSPTGANGTTCGHTSHGNTWAGSCAYTLGSAPTDCGI